MEKNMNETKTRGVESSILNFMNESISLPEKITLIGSFVDGTKLDHILYGLQIDESSFEGKCSNGSYCDGDLYGHLANNTLYLNLQGQWYEFEAQENSTGKGYIGNMRKIHPELKIPTTSGKGMLALESVKPIYK